MGAPGKAEGAPPLWPPRDECVTRMEEVDGSPTASRVHLPTQGSVLSGRPLTYITPKEVKASTKQKVTCCSYKLYTRLGGVS